jgi:hypothetical protein
VRVLHCEGRTALALVRDTIGVEEDAEGAEMMTCVYKDFGANDVHGLAQGYASHWIAHSMAVAVVVVVLMTAMVATSASVSAGAGVYVHARAHAAYAKKTDV